MFAVYDVQQVHEWFLHRGLPLVLTRRVRSRDLIERSAPMVSGVGALTAVTMLLAEVTGVRPDYGYGLRLGLIAAVLVAHIANRETDMVTLGAEIWFGARLVYLPLYAFGVRQLRSLVWLVSIAGLGMIVAPLVMP